MSSDTALRPAPKAATPSDSLHLFEFMDLDGLPLTLRNTLREILECGNAAPFRRYYQWATEKVVQQATAMGANQIVELGAGTAPLTRHLAEDDRCTARLSICDRNPDIESYRELQRRYPGKVTPIYDPIDFSQPRQWPQGTLLVLSATLHHLPDSVRRQAIQAMVQSAEAVLIVEPLRKTLLSLAFVCLSAIPAVLLPVWFINRPGLLRRVFWCWLLPAAPLAFLWDGWISCIRQWSDRRYQTEIAAMPHVSAAVTHTLFCQAIDARKLDASSPEKSI